MAQYPGSAGERRFQPETLAAYVTRVFAACGMTEDHAGLLSESLVAADQRGIHSHGTLRVPEYVTKLLDGGVNPRGQPRIASDRAGALVIDAGNATGQVAAAFAMERAIERARATHVAIAAVRGSNHCGAMDHWACRALPHDMVGIAMTNALPTMAPWGGVDKVVGINPLAVAIPGCDEPPLVLDIAFGATAHGKIRVYRQKGFPIPDGWAFDAEGNPTTDAARAMAGLIQPIGGYKGVGLGIVTGVLSSLLSGAAYGSELGNMTDGARAGQDGHLFMAIDIAAFQPPQAFRRRVDGIIREIRASRRRPDVDRLFAPGELEHDLEQRYGLEGIPLNDETVDGLHAAGRRLGLAPLGA